MSFTSDALDMPLLAPCGEAARLAVRRGDWAGAAAAPPAKCVQAHVVILPASLAGDFRDFCLRNPQACPLLAVSEPGQAMLPTLGDDIDVRCDVPGYQVWRDGEATDATRDIVSVWRRDLVTFVLAASSSCEQMLLAEAEASSAVRAPHRPVTPTYVTQVPTATAGPFGGPLWATMRPLRSDRLIRMVELATRLAEPQATPVHVGDPALIGIDDRLAPQDGEALRPAPDELPVFWASALTARAAARRARPALCITNAPRALLVTDLLHLQAATQDGPLRPPARPRSGW